MMNNLGEFAVFVKLVAVRDSLAGVVRSAWTL
jgi:hypothetical protein